MGQQNVRHRRKKRRIPKPPKLEGWLQRISKTLTVILVFVRLVALYGGEATSPVDGSPDRLPDFRQQVSI